MSENIEKQLIRRIKEHSAPLRIMHICGTHERTISKYGLRSILPPEVEVLSGPGCPVCVTPTEDIDFAIAIANSGATVVTFGDMIRVPGTNGSLFDTKSNGADVRMVYSIDDAIALAINEPQKEIVFFGIGFETTAPANAAAVIRGLPDNDNNNFSILTSHKLVPPAMEVLIKDINVDAFIAPGHVSTIIGTKPYQPFAKKGFPIVVAGFEAHDVLLSIAMIQQQVENGVSDVENAYPRAVNTDGNITAQKMMREAFDIVDSNWRGIGVIKGSGLGLKKKFEQWDAAKRYEEILETVKNTPAESDTDLPDCMCAEILTARSQPSECPMFGTHCVPNNPVGPCMVSLEGMCYNWYKYKN